MNFLQAAHGMREPREELSTPLVQWLAAWQIARLWSHQDFGRVREGHRPMRTERPAVQMATTTTTATAQANR